MSKHTYTATRPDGKIETRTTERTYTHVLIAHWENATDGSYTRVEWCGRLDLAQKAYKKYNKPGVNVTLTIIPVDNPREAIIETAGEETPAVSEPANTPEIITEPIAVANYEPIHGVNHYATYHTVAGEWRIYEIAPFSVRDFLVGTGLTRAYAEVEVTRLDRIRQEDERKIMARHFDLLTQGGNIKA